MSPRANAASQSKTEAPKFPKPSSPSLRRLFDYIQTHLWPKWSFQERHEFVHRRREQIVLSDQAGTLAQLLDKPSACSIFEEPYSAVSVSIGIAIWGVEGVQSRPAMWEFVTGNANRMASLFDNHPNNYGKSFKQLENQSKFPRFKTTGHSTASSQRLIEIKSENGKKRPHDSSEGKIYKLPRRNEPEAALSEPLAAVSGNGRVDEDAVVRPSRRPRRTVNYNESDSSNGVDAQCQLSHCSSECTELKTKLQATNEQLKKVTAEMKAQKEDSVTSLRQAKTSAQEQLAKAAEDRNALRDRLSSQARVGEEKLAQIISERDTLKDAFDNKHRVAKEQLAKFFAQRDALQAALNNQHRLSKDLVAQVVAEKDALQAALDSEVQARVGQEDMDKVIADKAALQESLDALREKHNTSLVLSFRGVAALKLILSDHAKTQPGNESTKIAQSLLGVVNDAYVRMLVKYSVDTFQTADSRRG